MSRREIESRNPATPKGHVRLDPQDVEEVYLDPLVSILCRVLFDGKI